jgi:CBS domain-containing protein
MKVKHLMSHNPVVVKPHTTVAEIARLLTAHRIGSVPVVDESGALVGLVTETDLFLRAKVIPFSMVRAPFLMGDWVDPGLLEKAYSECRQRTARQIMTKRVLTVDAEAEIGDAARLMMDNERKHLPVTRRGRLVGMLTRHDILRALCRPPQSASETVLETEAAV